MGGGRGRCGDRRGVRLVRRLSLEGLEAVVGEARVALAAMTGHRRVKKEV